MDSKQAPKNNISNDTVDDTVDISVILDRSGSMTYEWNMTIAALSDFLFKQQKDFPKGNQQLIIFPFKPTTSSVPNIKIIVFLYTHYLKKFYNKWFKENNLL
jgi:hypothetical protein